MAKKLHEGAPPMPSRDMGGMDSGMAGAAASWEKHGGASAAKHKEGRKKRKAHAKRV